MATERASEPDRTSEPGRAPLEAARARGHVGGRSRALTGAKVTAAHDLRAQGRSIERIAALLKVGETTLGRFLVTQTQEDCPGQEQRLQLMRRSSQAHSFSDKRRSAASMEERTSSGVRGPMSANALKRWEMTYARAI